MFENIETRLKNTNLGTKFTVFFFFSIFVVNYCYYFLYKCATGVKYTCI